MSLRRDSSINCTLQNFPDGIITQNVQQSIAAVPKVLYKDSSDGAHSVTLALQEFCSCTTWARHLPRSLVTSCCFEPRSLEQLAESLEHEWTRMHKLHGITSSAVLYQLPCHAQRLQACKLTKRTAECRKSHYLHVSAFIWSSIIMMHMPLSSFPRRPALPLIWMYSPLDIYLQRPYISNRSICRVVSVRDVRHSWLQKSSRPCRADL